MRNGGGGRPLNEIVRRLQMTRRRFVTIVAVVAALNLALLFASGFGAGHMPSGAASTSQTFARTAVDALLVPAIWIFSPTENTSLVVGGSVIIANSLLWGIVVAGLWTLVRGRRRAAF